MIKVLDKKIADKIAAGEVVERPLSIVKELLENAIDAQSDKITVEIKNGGKSYIRVTDNGCGIEKKEVPLAFLRHATSKISTEADLDNIFTLGFRGEALASICAVSRVEMITKSNFEKSGSRLLIYGGEVIENSNVGAPDGTTVVVRDLFYNTPARMKFLRSDKGEASVIIELVGQLALAYPRIRFTMINNDKILFSTNGKGNRIEAIATITSIIEANNLIEISNSQDDISVVGFISKPSYSKASRKGQQFFVNGRIVNNKTIEKGLYSAYSDRLFENRHPIAYIFLNIAPSKVDVNVHPNKREVKFFDEEFICSFIKESAITALNSHMAITDVKGGDFYTVKNENTDNKSSKSYSMQFNREINDKVDYNKFVEILSNGALQNEQSICDSKNISIEYTSPSKILNKYDETSTAENDKSLEIQKEIFERSHVIFDFTRLEIVGQIFGTYIQLKDDESIYFIDQHAAHERVFFEEFLSRYRDNTFDKQLILTPFSIDVSHDIQSIQDIWMNILNKIGFGMCEFGVNTYKVEEIPMFFDIYQSEVFLKDFFDTVSELGDFDEKATLDKIASKACKAAIKGNSLLDEMEIKSLLRSLEKCTNPYSCPHGRPTFIRIDKREIEKRFKRV